MMSGIKSTDHEGAIRDTHECAEVSGAHIADTSAELVTTETAKDIEHVAFSAFRGIRRYEIIKAPQEKLEEWKRGVDEIVIAIADKNLSRIRELMQKDGRLIGDADTVEKIILEETLDDIDIKLLAIGIFVLREKSPWHFGKSGLKILKGGKVKMESAFDPDGWANCYDMAAIVCELVKMYGIGCNIKGFSHAHVETADGKVSDPAYGWRRGGFFKNKEEFEAHKKKLGFLRRMGIKKDF